MHRNAGPDGFQTSLAELRQKQNLIGALPVDYDLMVTGDGKRALPAVGIPAPDKDDIEQRKVLEFAHLESNQEMCFTLYEDLEWNDYGNLRAEEEADFIASRRKRMEAGEFYLEAFDALSDVPVRPVLPASGAQRLTVRSAEMGTRVGSFNKRVYDDFGDAHIKKVKTQRQLMMYGLCGPTPPVTAATRYFTVAQKFKEATLGESYTHFLYVFARQDEGEPSLDLRGSASARAADPSTAAATPAQAELAPTARAEVPAPAKGGGTPRTSQRMSIERAVVATGTKMAVGFMKPMVAAPGEKFWITVVPSTAGDTAYTSYTYLEPDATKVDVATPAVAGDYELRLHGNYPTKTYNLIDRLKFRATQGDPSAEAGPAADSAAPAPEDKGGTSKMTALAKVRLEAKARFTVKFPKPLKAKRNEKYWIAIAGVQAGDADYTSYAYVDAGAKTADLTAPDAAGEYEVRLHGNYPTKKTNVVDRLKVTVK